MGRRLSAFVVAAASAGCTAAWSQRTTYASALTVDPSDHSLRCTVQSPILYAHIRTVTRVGGQFRGPRDSETWDPFLVQVSNSGEQIVTIDWEHSAFVDSVGSSYRVNLYPPESARYVTADQGPRTIDKPPVPVVPPGAHIDVFVMPERLPPSMFFLPPHEKEGAPLRFVLSTTGSSSPRAECIIRARLIKTETARSTEYPWPRDRDECLPELGCAEGLLCKEGICVDPRRPVVRPAPPKLSGKGGRCEMTEDCEPGLRCNLAFKMCREN